MAYGRHAKLPLSRRTRSVGRAVLAGASILSICAGIAFAAHIGAFFVHSSSAGHALINQERKAIAAAAGNATGTTAAGATAATACRQNTGSTSGNDSGKPHGLLLAPTLGMVAPVLQGTDDAVLSDAVGHDPASVWPGHQGTSVLSAHDVTWFSRVAQLKRGNEVRYVTPCRTYTYKVTKHAIVTAGSPVYNTGTARLVLETCYPLDALFITPTRYLVYASLVGSAPTHAMTVVHATWPVPRVPAPAELVVQGLGLDKNYAPLGTLSLTGSPSPAWTQSSAPLQFQYAALAAYFGLVRSAGQAEHRWWADLAPSVPVSAAGPLWGGQISGYDSKLQITLRVAGTRSVRALLTATVTVTGPEGTGSYGLVVGEAVRDGKLLVTKVAITPAG